MSDESVIRDGETAGVGRRKMLGMLASGAAVVGLSAASPAGQVFPKARRQGRALRWRRNHSAAAGQSRRMRWLD